MRFVPMNEWSKDHFSLLAYVETCCVDGQGILDHDRMRTNIPRHPGMAGPRIASIDVKPESSQCLDDLGHHELPRGKGSYKYPTRLRDGKIEKGHDDWDCLYDLEEAKLIVAQGTGVHPVLAMTEAGTRLVEMIRRHKSAGGSFSNFVVASEVVLAQGS